MQLPSAFRKTTPPKALPDRCAGLAPPPPGPPPDSTIDLQKSEDNFLYRFSHLELAFEIYLEFGINS
jgi:hypothetical protein